MPNTRRVHGTLDVPGKQHPVLDLSFWEAIAPLGDDRHPIRTIESPTDVARLEQARRLVLQHGPVGRSVPVDIFVWARETVRDRPWLTRLGGLPWMEKGAPWPRNSTGEHLCFLGQIGFMDSQDILPFELPGDVLLFFGQWQDGSVFDEENRITEQFIWSSS